MLTGNTFELKMDAINALLVPNAQVLLVVPTLEDGRTFMQEIRGAFDWSGIRERCLRTANNSELHIASTADQIRGRSFDQVLVHDRAKRSAYVAAQPAEKL